MPHPEPTPASLAAVSGPRSPRPASRRAPAVPTLADSPFGLVPDGAGGVWQRCGAECELTARQPGKPACTRCEPLEVAAFVDAAVARGACARCTRMQRAVFHTPCPYA